MRLCLLTGTLVAMALAPANQSQIATTQQSKPAEKPAPTLRELAISYADSTVGWKEASGRNDGPEIERILDSVGLKGTRSPYCAAWVYFVGKNALGTNNPYPRSAWSPDMVKNPTWVKGKGQEPQPADTFGLFFPSKNRVAHTGLVRRNLGAVIETTEANTSPDAAAGSAADRDGGGVYHKRRLKRQIYAFKNWLQ